MFRLSLFAFLLLFLSATVGVCDEYLLEGGVSLVLPSVPQNWTVTREPPAGLVDLRTKHMVHESVGNLTEAQANEVARSRLARTDLFFVHAGGGYMEVDVSPMEPREPAPGKKAVKASARYAGQSLEGEAGITNLHYHVRKTRINGMTYGYRVEAAYQHLGQPTRFIGVVGTVEGAWLFFYFTEQDPIGRTDDDVFTLLKAMEIRSQTQ